MIASAMMHFPRLIAHHWFADEALGPDSGSLAMVPDNLLAASCRPDHTIVANLAALQMKTRRVYCKMVVIWIDEKSAPA